jgi:Ca2+-binding EF-hand superfamily protein
MVTRIVSIEDSTKLRKVFLGMDINNDGVLTREEVAEGLKTVFGDSAPFDLDSIFAALDSDMSG